jgi:SOS-response transcriptional repressor LexA/DNA-binding Xre family transcriptional regulator
MDYIKRIKEVKSARKMTNDELSERTGIPGGTLSKILAGISETPKFCNIVAICEALNCSLDYIVYGLEENKNNYTLTDEEIELIEDYRALDARGQETVAALIESESTYAPRAERLPLRKGARILSPEPLAERLTAAYASNSNGLARIPLPLFDLPVSAGPGVALDYDDAEQIMVRDTTRTREADFALRISGNSMEPRYHDGDILLVQEAQTLEYGELGIFILDGEGYFKKFDGDKLLSLDPIYAPIPLSGFSEIQCAGRVIGKMYRK